jgi:hypothetical protein
MESEGSRRQSAGLTNRNRIRGESSGMRRHISSKSDTCTEAMVVYAAGISVKECAHYPGRPVCLPTNRVELLRLRDFGMGKQESAEVIVDRVDPIEGPNML